MGHSEHGHDNKNHQHHILQYSTGLKVFIGLLVLTAITVAAARVNLGMLNFPVAMFVATAKALMVVMLFMGLKWDHNDNRTIFGTSFVFVIIFITLTATDLFFRGSNSHVTAEQLEASLPKAKSKFKQAWNVTPEIMAHGKAMFTVQCASCHGAEGKGDGVAAAALNPKPRNFTQDAGWTNGRKPSQIFKTLKTGLNAMPSFSSLPADDRWSLAHYVSSLGPTALKDDVADLKAVGVDPNSSGGGTEEDKTIPVEAAIELMAEDGALK